MSLISARWIATLVATVAGILIVCGPFSRASAQCLASTRDIRFSDGSARVKNYVCKLANAAQPQLRVEFDRLSEAAAGSLLQGEPYPELERIFGMPRVLENAVQAEAKSLFDKFGTKSADESCFRLTVSAGSGGRDYDQNREKQPCGKRTLWYLTFPDQMDYTAIQMPLPDQQKYVQQKTDWPPGYNFYYTKCTDKSLIGCTQIWRPARQADIRDYDKNRKAYEDMLNLGRPADPPAGASDAAADDASYESSRARYFSLLDYLNRDGWHDDFLTITGEVVEDGCGAFDFQLHIRQLILDVAFVENISKDIVSLEGLLGAAGTESVLRKLDPRSSAAPASGAIPISTVKLAPGQTLAIPLRIAFAPAAGLQTMFKDQAAARATYGRIQALPRGTVIRQKASPGEPPPLRKVRESFGPPTAPSFTPYIYGPELNLRGVVLNGQRLDFESASRNFMRLTAGEGYGSCPYLYAWDGETWIRRGKVIHAANAKEKETTQEVSFAGLMAKFRLREEELEVSYIDRARLELDLDDGTRIVLHSDIAALAETDGSYATIRAWETLEFDFKLPPGLNTEDVTRSTLAITGYYRPYSRMLVGQR